MKINISLQQGFTMIETLIAVAILMISIAGPLTIAQKGLTAATYARDQVTASFLAQDVMEYVKNVRDYNVKRANPNSLTDWLIKMDDCTFASPCAVDTVTDTFRINPSTFVLSRDGLGYFISGTRPSQFSRKFYIVPFTSRTRPHEVKGVVEVSWKNGTVENVVTLENQLFNIQR